ncbi:MAG: hypothetical protein FJ214_12625 [Ignavibacteria bacterium]|nr:hypothetical protein [Ignavibacteria bacterium]
MIKSFLRFIVISVLIITNSCNSPTEPEPLPGRRDYLWKVDTINPGNESLYLLRLWGSSPNDVWAVGSSSSSTTSIWHYNGKQWQCDLIPRRVAPYGLFGFSQNYVWLGNSSGFNTIWHYNGNNWYQFAELIPEEGYHSIDISNFDGLKYNDVFGVGIMRKYPTEKYEDEEYKGLIMNFNGFEWKFLKIPEVKTQFTEVAVDPKSKDLVLAALGMTPERYFLSQVYSWDGKELKELLSDIGGSTSVTKLGNEIFASYSSKIYKYENKSLILWKNNHGTPMNGNIICGRSRNDFFLSANGGIAHYNGSDFNIIYKTDPTHQVQILIGLLFKNDVFFIEHNFTLGRNLIIHGTLN